MKNFNSFFTMIFTAGLCILIACENESVSPSEDISKQLEGRVSQNSLVYPPTSHPFGKTYAEWGAAWWAWAFSLDCASNPILDTDGSLQDQNQSGPVHFLAGSTGAVVSRDVTIPAGKAVLFPIINIINDYPCPDPDFQPAPGQSLEEFLTEGATGFINLVDELTVTLDGTTLTNLPNYRSTSSLFNFTGNPDLINCADPCVTGEEQQAVSDGYWIMLKPMSSGSHTLHFTGGVSVYGFTLDVTYNIMVE